MKLINICGARPNFMKIAPLMRAYQAHAAIEQTRRREAVLAQSHPTSQD